jgi:hypothetical protein
VINRTSHLTLRCRNVGARWFAQTGTSADIGAAHHGDVADWFEPGSSDDIWDDEHPPNRMLMSGIPKFRFSVLSLKVEDSVHPVDYVEAVVDAIFDLGMEAQAEVAEDWLPGWSARPRNPEPSGHTRIPMDARSPCYRYITDNVRAGRS